VAATEKTEKITPNIPKHDPLSLVSTSSEQDKLSNNITTRYTTDHHFDHIDILANQ